MSPPSITPVEGTLVLKTLEARGMSPRVAVGDILLVIKELLETFGSTNFRKMSRKFSKERQVREIFHHLSFNGYIKSTPAPLGKLSYDYNVMSTDYMEAIE